MDLDAIRLEVFKRTGLNIEKNDPFFAALVMFSMVGEDIKAKHDIALTRIDAIAKKLTSSQVQSNTENGEALNAAIEEIRAVVGQLTGMQGGIERAAANSAKQILLEEGGPVSQFKALVKQQKEAMEWVNRVTDFYDKSIVPAILPIVLTSMLCSLCVGLLIKHF